MRSIVMAMALVIGTAAPVDASPRWVTTSTMYCLHGGTPGGVAVSLRRFPLMRGQRWKVVREDRPRWAVHGNLVLGRTFTVADKGPRARFDMWTSNCALAREYGGRTVAVERVR